MYTVQWCLREDCFSFESLDLGTLEVASTKRSVLSLIAKVFDPLGLISPFIMSAKIFFQDIWRLGLSWDEMLPELKSKFKEWVKGITVLHSWKINRCFFPGVPWKMVSGIELHAFGDASEKGYGACVYMRIP